MSRKSSARLIASFLLLLCLPAAALAQAVSGSITGTVTDTSGAAVQGAKIVVTDVNKGVTFNTTTNESGNYSQRYLIVGRYQVRVEAPGFQTFVQDNVGVSVDFHLKLFSPNIRFQTCQMCDLATADYDALMHHYLLADQDVLSTNWQANDPAPLQRDRGRF